MLVSTVLTLALATAGNAFVHPGLLQSSADFNKIKLNVAAANQPWLAGYQKLLNSPYATPTYKPSPAATIYHGLNRVYARNYSQLYNNISTAYILLIL